MEISAHLNISKVRLHNQIYTDIQRAHMEDVMHSSESDNESAEQIVSKIVKMRFNKKKDRNEWFVIWADGTQSWEPEENLVDPDGTRNIELLKFELRQKTSTEGHKAGVAANNNIDNQSQELSDLDLADEYNRKNTFPKWISLCKLLRN